MKSYIKKCLALLFVTALIFLAGNILLLKNHGESSTLYKVETSRVIKQLKAGGPDSVDISSYSTILNAVSEETEPDIYSCSNQYIIAEVNGTLCRIEYTTESDSMKTQLLIFNSSMGILTAVMLALMVTVLRRVLLPFHRLRELPFELSKGNLSTPLKESKSRLFGRFTWGMNLLRENLEQSKQRELELQKEKKTLLLSLSHDIKTPLSAIKLYSKALSKGIYTDTAKQHEIYEGINAKADEIESYVTQIVKASSEDFLSINVNPSEFYLSEIIESIRLYYTDKLSLTKTEFTIAGFDNCLVSGDPDRSVEVLQNLIENAMKYGDGKSISLAFREEDGCQLVTVKNSGDPLPANEMSHIFDSFYRGSNSDGKNGSGLGLYICRQIMRKMNGDIFAEYENGFMSVTCVFQKA